MLSCVSQLPAWRFIPFPAAEISVLKSADDEIISPLVRYYGPNIFSYHELVEISTSPEVTTSVRQKLDSLFNSTFISNESSLSGAATEFQRSDWLGDYIRVGAWNIQYGLRLDDIKLALGDLEGFRREMNESPGTKDWIKILAQLEVLKSVGILVLNEVDFGMKRTGYRDVSRELATALNMNYAFAVNYLEIDPFNLGTEEFRRIRSAMKRDELRRSIEVDPDRYRGLYGTAILSRFPIKSAVHIPLKYQPYDWYGKEKKRVSWPEAARRGMSRAAFLETAARQIRHGGRSILIVELEIPQLPEGLLTVIATQLENRCKPAQRRRQMQEVLSLIKDIGGPVVLAGDFNTSGSDLSPTSFKREITNRLSSEEFWAKQTVKLLAPLGLAADLTISTAGNWRSMHDPTSKGVLFFAKNKERFLFGDLESWRFSDGYAFDFRGDSYRTINGTKGTLANSNQRSTLRGFSPTYSVKRNFWGVGRSKLDWILVKAYSKEPRATDQPYRLAPHFPRTLEALNYSLGKSRRLSDHNPITVDLPILEPGK